MTNYHNKKWCLQRALTLPCCECGELPTKREGDGHRGDLYHSCLSLAGPTYSQHWLLNNDPQHPDYEYVDHVARCREAVITVARRLINIKTEAGNLGAAKESVLKLFDRAGELRWAFRHLDAAERAFKIRKELGLEGRQD